ncbi:MAG: putative LPS assembly protein LptD [candidate division WOR-3 bacterium]|nr:putative LPS assembly protein LptD [candidate division WOR-3 bacterium]
MIFYLIIIINFNQLDTISPIAKAESTKIVNYSSKNIIYLPQDERIILLDSAQVNYIDLEVKADSIVYNLKTKTLSAYKNVKFSTATDKIDGTELHYNLKSKKGVMLRAKTSVADGFFQGQELWLIKEKTLQVADGYYTTCDKNPPHYHFYGKRLKVFLNDMAITQPIVLRIRQVPILAAPFWFFPIGKERKSGLLPFKVGQSKTEGIYLKGLSYYLVINDYADITLALDAMEKRGFQPKLEGIYIVNPYARGQLLLSYIYESQAKRHRYSINSKHTSKFFFNSNLDAYIDYQSDQTYLPDYAENQVQWLKKELYSQVSLNRDFAKIGRTHLLLEQRKEFEKSITDWKLPAWSMNFYRVPLIANWSITPGIGFANIEKIFDSTAINPIRRKNIIRSINSRVTLANPKTPIGVFDLPISSSYKISKNITNTTSSAREFRASTGFSTAQNFLSTLNINEGISYNHTIIYTDTTIPQVVYDFNISSDITLFRLFKIGFLGVKDILHKVSPSIAINLTPQTKHYGIWGIPRTDTTPQNLSFGFGLSNYFQGKFSKPITMLTKDTITADTIIRPRETKHRQREYIKQDLASIGFQSNYDFKAKTLAPLAINADVYPINQENIKLQSSLTLIYPWQLKPLNQVRISELSINSFFNYLLTKTDTITNEEYGIKITLMHLYIASSDGFSPLKSFSHMLNITLSLIPKSWHFNIISGYNFKEKKLTDYNISIWKDLHCWEAIININRLGPKWAYDFKVRIKKIPEVSLGKGMLGFILPVQ